MAFNIKELQNNIWENQLTNSRKKDYENCLYDPLYVDGYWTDSPPRYYGGYLFVNGYWYFEQWYFIRRTSRNKGCWCYESFWTNTPPGYHDGSAWGRRLLDDEADIITRFIRFTAFIRSTSRPKAVPPAEQLTDDGDAGDAGDVGAATSVAVASPMCAGTGDATPGDNSGSSSEDDESEDEESGDKS